MKRPARFHPLAEREFTEAAEYFERESIGLGAASIAAVERCVAEIIEYPESGRRVVGTVRRRLVRRFPYSVLYSTKADHIRVLAVMHASPERPTGSQPTTSLSRAGSYMPPLAAGMAPRV